MKNVWKKHPEIILITCAAVFLCGIIGSFAWGIGDIVSEVNRALKFNSAITTSGFNLDAAAKLNYHGVSVDASSTTQQ